jgi:outer membrane immunogenic protein
LNTNQDSGVRAASFSKATSLVVAGRLGYASDKVLIYGKGGVAFVNKSYGFNDNCSVVPCGIATLNINRSTTQTTWAAGGGLEYALTSNWSVKGEYLYLATRETFTVSGTGVGGGGAPFTDRNSHTDPGVHTGKFGINYRFGGPVVARY